MAPSPTIPLAHDVVDAAVDGQPAVVLVHGLTQQRHFWGPVMTRVAASPDHPRLIAVDARGHGDTGGTGIPFDVSSCAADLAALLDERGEVGAVVVGHSWGGAVAAQLAAARPDLVAALVMVDGGFTRLADLGPRDEVRQRLIPPRLGIPLDELFAMISAGELAPWWSDELYEALLPTFEVGGDGLARTRLGYDRHLEVLDGMLDYDARAVLSAVSCPAWLVSCEALPGSGEAPRLASTVAVMSDPRVLRWAGAIHDVPLQWPWMVAGLIRTAVAEVSAVGQTATREVAP